MTTLLLAFLSSASQLPDVEPLDRLVCQSGITAVGRVVSVTEDREALMCVTHELVRYKVELEAPLRGGGDRKTIELVGVVVTQ